MEKFSRLLSAVALLQGMFGSKLPSKENYSSRQGRVGFWTGPAVQSTRYSPETNSRVRGRDNKYVLESTFGEQWPVVSTAINSRLQWEQKWKWERRVMPHWLYCMMHLWRRLLFWNVCFICFDASSPYFLIETGGLCNLILALVIKRQERNEGDASLTWSNLPWNELYSHCIAWKASTWGEC